MSTIRWMRMSTHFMRIEHPVHSQYSYNPKNESSRNVSWVTSWRHSSTFNLLWCPLPWLCPWVMPTLVHSVSKTDSTSSSRRILDPRKKLRTGGPLPAPADKLVPPSVFGTWHFMLFGHSLTYKHEIYCLFIPVAWVVLLPRSLLFALVWRTWFGPCHMAAGFCIACTRVSLC